MKTARLIATKNPEALAGAHRVQDLKAFDCAFDVQKGIKGLSNHQAFPLKSVAYRATEIGRYVLRSKVSILDGALKDAA